MLYEKILYFKENRISKKNFLFNYDKFNIQNFFTGYQQLHQQFDGGKNVFVIVNVNNNQKSRDKREKNRLGFCTR